MLKAPQAGCRSRARADEKFEGRSVWFCKGLKNYLYDLHWRVLRMRYKSLFCFCSVRFVYFFSACELGNFEHPIHTSSILGPKLRRGWMIDGFKKAFEVQSSILELQLKLHYIYMKDTVSFRISNTICFKLPVRAALRSMLKPVIFAVVRLVQFSYSIVAQSPVSDVSCWSSSQGCNISRPDSVLKRPCGKPTIHWPARTSFLVWKRPQSSLVETFCRREVVNDSTIIAHSKNLNCWNGMECHFEHLRAWL